MYGGVRICHRFPIAKSTVDSAPNCERPVGSASILSLSSAVSFSVRFSSHSSCTTKGAPASGRHLIGVSTKPVRMNACVSPGQSELITAWIPRANASIIASGTVDISPKSRKTMRPSSASMMFPS